MVHLDEIWYRRELVPELLSLAIVAVIIYFTFKSSRTDEKKRPLFLAFSSYALYLVLHMYNRFIDAGFLALPHSEVVAAWDHFFKCLFFIIYGYSLLSVLITDELILKIAKRVTYLAASVIYAFVVASLLIEGGEFVFDETAKELFLEGADLVFQLIIINIVLTSWMDTRSKNLLITGIAFILFSIANSLHLYNLIFTFSIFNFIVFHWIRVGALVLLLYTAMPHRIKK